MAIPFEITPDILQAWAERRPEFCHPGYCEAVKKYEDLKVHANGETPVEIIDARRPSEPDIIKDYRDCIFEPIQKGNIGKVVGSLSKIPRSSDWSIKYPSEAPASITKDESLQKYCEDNFPYYTSVTNWTFRALLRNNLLDANAVILVLPLNINKPTSDYFKPFPFIFNSPQVIDFRDGEYCVLISAETVAYKIFDDKGVFIQWAYDGVKMHVVDTLSITTYVQTGAQFSMTRLGEPYIHGLGEMPAFKVAGIYYKDIDRTIINVSRIEDMVPHLNEMVRIYSDLQAEMVQHVHSDKWIYQNTECRTCNGSGREIHPTAGECDCHSCKGSGYVSVSPYGNIVLRPPNAIEGQQPVPTPPAGYVQKTDVALMVEKMDQAVEKHSYQSLAAINMQFLYQVPLSESGIAKEVDRDESNNFVYSVAEDIVYAMDRIYYYIALYRYIGLLGSRNNVIKLLPKINVPEKYDLLSPSLLLDEITKAKQNNVSDLIVAILENEYTQKKFHNNPDLVTELNLAFRLDPMVGVNDDTKALRLTNNGITLETYIISSNIVTFVRRAIADTPGFAKLPITDQAAKMQEYAREIMESNSPAAQITIPESPENDLA